MFQSLFCIIYGRNKDERLRVTENHESQITFLHVDSETETLNTQQ